MAHFPWLCLKSTPVLFLFPEIFRFTPIFYFQDGKIDVFLVNMLVCVIIKMYLQRYIGSFTKIYLVKSTQYAILRFYLTHQHMAVVTVTDL